MLSGVITYRITRKVNGQTWQVTCCSPKQAWAKFVTQWFGPLKPARSDYRIVAEQP